jgi:hypothetical protein
MQLGVIFIYNISAGNFVILLVTTDLEPIKYRRTLLNTLLLATA